MDDQELEIDVAECIFTVKDADGNNILTTPDVNRAFQTKKLMPGSKVFVDAKIDVTIETFNVIQKATEQ